MPVFKNQANGLQESERIDYGDSVPVPLYLIAGAMTYTRSELERCQPGEHDAVEANYQYWVYWTFKRLYALSSLFIQTGVAPSEILNVIKAHLDDNAHTQKFKTRYASLPTKAGAQPAEIRAASAARYMKFTMDAMNMLAARRMDTDGVHYDLGHKECKWILNESENFALKACDIMMLASPNPNFNVGAEPVNEPLALLLEVTGAMSRTSFYAAPHVNERFVMPSQIQLVKLRDILYRTNINGVASDKAREPILRIENIPAELKGTYAPLTLKAEYFNGKEVTPFMTTKQRRPEDAKLTVGPMCLK